MEEEKMTVSVIIPVYNVEKFLKRCVDSVLEQTYTNLEIILVDDGSLDSSGKICDQISLTDERIKVIHKENGGLSSSRNAGRNVATGDYILYLDSDDYLEKNCIKHCVDLCGSKEADIAIIRMLYTSEQTNEELHEGDESQVKVLTPEEAIEASLYQELYSCCAPAKLYRADIAKAVQFPLGKISEDLATCHLFLDKASKVVYSNKIGYYYRQRSASIMHDFNPKRMDALQWATDIYNYCKKKHPAIVGAAKCRLFNVAIHLALDLPDSGELHDKLYPVIWKEIRATRIHTIFDRKVRFRERAAAIISFFGEKFLKRIWNGKIALKRKEV